MFVLINGAFGIGKTTTARGLVPALAGAVLHDPEPLGIALQQLSRFARPSGRVEDFQDLASWRYLTATTARWRHRPARLVLIPMAFSNPTIFEQLSRRLGAGAAVLQLCLTAPWPVIADRLDRRARATERATDPWVLRRAAECCEAHRSGTFGRPVDATPSTETIVGEIVSIIARERGS